MYSAFANLLQLRDSRVRSIGAKRGYLPELMGLRGIAIAIVALGHLTERVDRFISSNDVNYSEHIFFDVFATPFSGCCLFFCISGYLLMHQICNDHINLTIVSVTIYVKTRVLRIIPPYFIILLFNFIFLEVSKYEPVGTNQFNVVPHSLLQSLAASLILSHDVIFGTFPRLFPPGWFIETQVQFYIVGPVIWGCYLRLTAYHHRVRLGIALLLVFSIIALLNERYGPQSLHYNVIAFLPYFWIGALMAEYQIYGRGGVLVRLPGWSSPMGWCALLTFIAVGAKLDEPVLQLGARVACLAMLILASFVPHSSFRGMILSRWLALLGALSYSLYLVHLQVLQVVTPPLVRWASQAGVAATVLICSVVGIGAVLLCSAVFYRLIERPLAEINRRPGRPGERAPAQS